MGSHETETFINKRYLIEMGLQRALDEQPVLAPVEAKYLPRLLTCPTLTTLDA